MTAEAAVMPLAVAKAVVRVVPTSGLSAVAAARVAAAVVAAARVVVAVVVVANARSRVSVSGPKLTAGP